MILTKRAGKLGRSINTRTEVHGEELVPAIDIRISELVLGEEELDLLLEAGAHEALFTGPDNDLKRRFPMLGALSVEGKLKDQVVTLSVPPVMGEEAEAPVILVPATLKDVTLQPQEGGTTKLSMMVQQSDPLDEDVSALMHWMGHEVEVEVRPAEKHELEAEAQASTSAQVEAPV